MLNYNLLSRLPKKQPTGLVIAYLLPLDSYAFQWEFAIPPNEIRISGSNSYTVSYPYKSDLPVTDLQHADQLTISISNAYFFSVKSDVNFSDHIQALDNLRKPIRATNNPPKLAIVLGKRTIQPLYLNSYSVSETRHVDGFPCELTASLDFIAAGRVTL